MNLANYSCKYFGGSETLSSYLNEVRKHKVPTPEEEEEIFDKIFNGDEAEKEKAKTELIIRNQRFVYAMAKIYARNEDEVLDYVNEGNIGLIESIDRFDPSKGFKFITYAVNYIKREMNYYLMTTNNIIKRPNNMKLGKKIDTVKHKFFAENGYLPTDEEIIEVIKTVYGISIKDKSDVFDLNVSSISEKLDDDKYTVEDDDEFNRKTSTESEYETTVNDDYNSLLVNNILSSIPAETQDILKMCLGIGMERSYTLEEIGEKYDLDEQTVLDIKNKTLKYLRQNKHAIKVAI